MARVRSKVAPGMKTLPTQSWTRPPGTGFTALAWKGSTRISPALMRLRAVRRFVGPEEDLGIGQALLGLADVAVERLDGFGLEFGRAGREGQQGRQRGPSHTSILTRRC